MKKRMLYLVARLLLAVMVLSACAAEPAVETVEVEVTRVVEVEGEPVEVTRIVEIEGETVVEEVVVTATPEPVEEVEQTMPEGDTILIGGFGPLSAPGSYQGGTEMRQAAEMAVDEINDAGGVLGK